MNLSLQDTNRIQYLGKWRTRTEDHVLHVPVIRLQCRPRVFGWHERNLRRRRQLVMRPAAAVELALEGDNGIEKRNVGDRANR